MKETRTLRRILATVQAQRDMYKFGALMRCERYSCKCEWRGLTRLQCGKEALAQLEGGAMVEHVYL